MTVLATKVRVRDTRWAQRIQAMIFLAALSGACGDAADPPEDAVRSDSAGVMIVRNTSVDRELDWRLERLLVLGGVEEGPTAFFRVFPSSVGVDAAGNLYVLDAGNYAVAVFDKTGRHLRSIGRQGGGPGEFGFPTDLAVGAGGDIAVYDFDRRGLTRFNADGEFTGEFPILGPLQRQVALLDDGAVVAAVTQPTSAPDSTDFRLVLLDDDTIAVSAVRQFTGSAPKEFSCGSRSGRPYFGPRIVWGAAAHRIVFSEETTYSVRVMGPDALEGIWSRALAPIPSTLDLAAWEVAQGDSLRALGCTIEAEEAARKFGYGEVVPAIESLAVTPGGGVWIRRRTSVPGDLQIDVLDAKGTYVGTLPFSSPFPAVFRGEDEFVSVERDALDRPMVVVYKLVGN